MFTTTQETHTNNLKTVKRKIPLISTCDGQKWKNPLKKLLIVFHGNFRTRFLHTNLQRKITKETCGSTTWTTETDEKHVQT